MAVAALAWLRIVAGPFRTIAMFAGAGEEEKRWALHVEFWLKARTAFLAVWDRSIVEERSGVMRNSEGGRNKP